MLETPVYKAADLPDDRDIVPFVVAADVVGLTRPPFLDDEIDTTAVILDIQPVPDIGTVAIYGHWFSCQGVDDHQRNEFFRKMVGSVVIRAIAGAYLQTVRVVIGTDQMVRCRFARGIRRVRCVRCLLGERIIVGTKRPINFIRRDMMKAMR